MACNIKSQLIENIKASPVFKYSLMSRLIVQIFSINGIGFVWYVKNKTIEEDFLFCRSLKTTTKATNVQKLVEDSRKIGLEQTLKRLHRWDACYAQGAIWIFDTCQTEKP